MTIMTYNIRGLMWKYEYTKLLSNLIKQQKIDICCFQEVFANRVVVARSGFNKKVKHGLVSEFLIDLMHQLGSDYSYISKFSELNDDLAIGNPIIFNKRIIKKVGEPLYKKFPLISQRGFLEEFSGKFLMARPKSILSQKFKIGDRSIIISNCHLDIFGGDVSKVFQIGDLLKFWQSEKNQNNCAEFLIGDFNTWTPYKLRNRFEDFTLLHKFLSNKGFIDLVDDISWTQEYDIREADILAKDMGMSRDVRYKILKFLGGLIKQDLDHVWGRGDIKLINNKRFNLRLSDHYPIMCKVDV